MGYMIGLTLFVGVVIANYSENKVKSSSVNAQFLSHYCCVSALLSLSLSLSVKFSFVIIVIVS